VTFAVAALPLLGVTIPAAGATEAEDGTTDETPEGTPAANGGEPDPASYLDSLRAGFSFVRGTVVSRAMLATIVANASIGGVLAAVTSPMLVMYGGAVDFVPIAAPVLAVPELRRLPRIDETETLRC
jgi:hypothetical protein